MRAPPMRQPTAAPAIAPTFDGPGVALATELEDVEDVGEVACGGVEVCEAPGTCKAGIVIV